MVKHLVLGGSAGVGLAHLRNIDAVADPTVADCDGRPYLIHGGMHGNDRVVHLYASDIDVGTGALRVTTSQDDPETALRLAEPPPRDAWDATGYHCPSYVHGPVERVYYASSAAWTDINGPYRIGFLECDGEGWRRYPEPVFVGELPWERGTVLEPNVRYAEGRWYLRYTAGLGGPSRSVVGEAESEDGIHWQRTGAPIADRFDSLDLADGLLTSRHPLDGAFTSTDGLWLGDRQILRSQDGTSWHDAGAWKPTALRVGEEPLVFCTAAQRRDSFPVFGIGCVRVPMVPR